MKYIVIDQTTTDMFSCEFNTIEEAIKEADKEFNRLTDHDLRQRTEFYILESQNPDEDAMDHFDGNIVKRYK